MTNIMYICGIVTSILILCYFIARYTKSSKMFLLSLLSVTLGIASYVIYYSYLNRNADEKLLISMIDDNISQKERIEKLIGKTSFVHID